MWGTRVWSLAREDPLEKEMATYSSALAWKIPWPEDPGRLQSMGLQIVRHDWATSLSFFPCGYLGYKSLILHYRGAPSSKAHGGFQKLSAVHLQVFPLWESPCWKNSGLVAYLESFYFPSLPVFCKHCYCSVFRLGLIYLWRYLWRLPLWNKVRFIYISVFRVCFRILWASFIWQDKTEKEPGLFVTLEISSPQKCPKAQPIGIHVWPAASFLNYSAALKQQLLGAVGALGLHILWKINILTRMMILLMSPFSAFKCQGHRIQLCSYTLPPLGIDNYFITFHYSRRLCVR